MKKLFALLFLIAVSSVVAHAQHMTTTHYGMKKPNHGVLNWNSDINGDLDQRDGPLGGPLRYADGVS